MTGGEQRGFIHESEVGGGGGREGGLLGARRRERRALQLCRMEGRRATGEREGASQRSGGSAQSSLWNCVIVAAGRWFFLVLLGGWVDGWRHF